jgi:DNA-binding response OmpR family regulator
MRVLVIDDSADLRDLLSLALVREDHRVVAVEDLQGADAALAQSPVDLVILDLDLPDGWGAAWCQRARREGLEAFVLVLSGHTEVARRLEAFEAGADDFLAKPFAVAELRARVRALGRRRGAGCTTALRHEDTEVDLAARQARRAGHDAPLTAREWCVLECLWTARGRVVARGDLLDQVWGDSSEGSAASLEVLVARIRRKLGPAWIRTARGEGYALGV